MSFSTKLYMFLVLSFLSVSQYTAQVKPDAVQESGEVWSGVPQKINVKARYLFYISGYIVEAGNLRPTSPKYGVYEYEKILDAFKPGGFVITSEARQQSQEIEPSPELLP